MAWASASLISAPAPFFSWNFSGTVEPNLNTLPLVSVHGSLTGWVKPTKCVCTVYGKEMLDGLPAPSWMVKDSTPPPGLFVLTVPGPGQSTTPLRRSVQLTTYAPLAPSLKTGGDGDRNWAVGPSESTL